MQRFLQFLAASFLGLCVLSTVQAQKPTPLVKQPGIVTPQQAAQLVIAAPATKPAPKMKSNGPLNPQLIGQLGAFGDSNSPLFPSESQAARNQLIAAQPDLAVTDVTITALGNGQFQYQAHIANLDAKKAYAGKRTWSLRIIYDPRLDGGERALPVTTVKTDGGLVQSLTAGQSMTISGTFTRTDQFGSISCNVQISQGDANRGNDFNSAVIVLGN